MTIGQHVTSFAGKPVEEYDPKVGLTQPSSVAYRLALEYDGWDGGLRMPDLVAKFLAEPAADRVEALVVGPWDFESSENSSQIVEALAASHRRLPALRALFLGDITYEESEISWIQQSDVTPLLAAYPALEHFRVRGGTGLVLDRLDHEALRTLVVEAGGLPASVVRAVTAAKLPNLEHLELWLGSSNYGGDSSVGDLAPILSGRRFPKLTHLALRNGEYADEIARAVATAPVLARLRTLDLSMGNLSDEGGEALLASRALDGLASLDLHHHYLSAATVRRLKDRFGPRVDVGDARSADDEDDRYIAVAE